MTQLTGFSDPVYAEAYVHVNQYDIVLDVLIVNQTSDTLQNLTLELATLGKYANELCYWVYVYFVRLDLLIFQAYAYTNTHTHTHWWTTTIVCYQCVISFVGDLKLVDKPQPVIMGPHDFTNIKASVKVASTENGIIFGNIGIFFS